MYVDVGIILSGIVFGMSILMLLLWYSLKHEHHSRVRWIITTRCIAATIAPALMFVFVGIICAVAAMANEARLENPFLLDPEPINSALKYFIPAGGILTLFVWLYALGSSWKNIGGVCILLHGLLSTASAVAWMMVGSLINSGNCTTVFTFFEWRF